MNLTLNECMCELIWLSCVSVKSSSFPICRDITRLSGSHLGTWRLAWAVIRRLHGLLQIISMLAGIRRHSSHIMLGPNGSKKNSNSSSRHTQRLFVKSCCGMLRPLAFAQFIEIVSKRCTVRCSLCNLCATVFVFVFGAQTCPVALENDSALRLCTGTADFFFTI